MWIPHNKSLITKEDTDVVVGVLKSGQLATGVCVREFEEAFCDLYGSGYACAVSSGTAALYLALKILDTKGISIVLPTYTCSAVLNAIDMAGALPVVRDVKENDFTIITNSVYSAGRAVAVHTFGAVSEDRAGRGKVISDCSQSLGGCYEDGGLIGSNSTVAVFSFYATKIITCGHGGLLWSEDRGLIEGVKDIREFDQRVLYKPRFNFHMTDFQAKMAMSQLGRLREIRERRQEIAETYMAALPDEVETQTGFNPQSMIYRFVLRLPNRLTRDEIGNYLLGERIEAIIPIRSYELLHNCLGYDSGLYLVAEKLVDTTLSIPLYPALKDEEVKYVCERLERMSAGKT